MSVRLSPSPQAGRAEMRPIGLLRRPKRYPWLGAMAAPERAAAEEASRGTIMLPWTA
jgi:hypothetical protein